jgi:hypothetical protein
MEAKTSLESRVPPTALAYCTDLHRQYQFHFLLSRPRRSRLGDFTSRPGIQPRITVNVNLNPYNFLITYIHEVAHCVVYQQYRNTPRKRIAPHGREWKREFARLLEPVMNETVFPADILQPLRRYALNPKASTGADQALYGAIRNYDESLYPSNKMPLIQLTEGAHFVFQNRLFERGLLRRTRVLCTEQKSKRRYTIPAHALVEKC